MAVAQSAVGQPGLDCRARLEGAERFDRGDSGSREFGLHVERDAGQDEHAVRPAIVEPWSKSPVEGQINRLKLIKRSMYGSRI